MNNLFRATLSLGVLAAAVVSQAVVFSYSGQTTAGATATAPFVTAPPPGSLASQLPFLNLTTGIVSLQTALNPGTVVFTTAGTTPDTVTITFNPAPKDTATGLSSLSAIGTITAGTGAFASYVSPLNQLTVTSNTFTGTGLNFFTVLGNVNPVPEPTSFAALAIGGLALVRRRRKA